MRTLRSIGLWLVIGMGLGVGIGFRCFAPSSLPPGTEIDRALVDSLRTENLRLERQRDSLARAYAVSDSMRRVAMAERTVATRALARAQARLDSITQTLPRALPPGTDSAQAVLYALVRTQLDSAVALVRRQRERITADSGLLAAAHRREANLLAQVFTVTQQRDNVTTERDEWERKYTALAAARPSRCQWKCGVVLGVTGTVLAAVAVRQVQHAIRP